MLARDRLSVSSVCPIRKVAVPPAFAIAFRPTSGVPANFCTSHPADELGNPFNANQKEKITTALAPPAANPTHSQGRLNRARGLPASAASAKGQSGAVPA